jgi:hypothetical protein
MDQGKLFKAINTNHVTIMDLSRDELKQKLRNKISSQRNIRTTGISRSKTDDMNASLRKLAEYLQNKNIVDVNQIDNELIENIMSFISKSELEIMLSKMQNNSQFKDILSNIHEKMNTADIVAKVKETAGDNPENILTDLIKQPKHKKRSKKKPKKKISNESNESNESTVLIEEIIE